jgi:hypothetical protein
MVNSMVPYLQDLEVIETSLKYLIECKYYLIYRRRCNLLCISGARNSFHSFYLSPFLTLKASHIFLLLASFAVKPFASTEL